MSEVKTRFAQKFLEYQEKGGIGTLNNPLKNEFRHESESEMQHILQTPRLQKSY